MIKENQTVHSCISFEYSASQHSGNKLVLNIEQTASPTEIQAHPVVILVHASADSAESEPDSDADFFEALANLHNLPEESADDAEKHSTQQDSEEMQE